MRTILKKIGRKAIIAAMDHVQIDTEQYSRPQRSAVAQRINRRLVFDYKQYLQKTFYISCSALKSCYDRIVHSAVSLDLQRLGIPLLLIVSMIDTIQRMLHTVRTSTENSNITYGRDTISNEFSHLMMGLCQGNCSAPRPWSIISSILFSSFQTEGFDIHFLNYFTIEISQSVGFSYVYDCDMIQSDDDIESTHPQMQLAILE